MWIKYAIATITILLMLQSISFYPVAVNKIPTQTFDRMLEIQLPDGFDEQDNKNFNIQENKETFTKQLPSNYLIITTELLWSAFNNNFRAWKELNDDKITNVYIVNVSTITSDADCYVNGTYGDAKSQSDGNPWIDDGKEVTASFSLFNDTQCKIRNYIRKCVTEDDVGYVLLGGNNDLIPARMVCSYAHSGPDGSWYNDTSHASDMYYACLNYSMNNNTNSRWMENNFYSGIYWAHIYSWDEIDWDYDALVGRVLANTVDEANYWITKTKNYIENNSNYTTSSVVASKDSGNNIDDYVWNRIGDEFPENISFLNGQYITQDQWNILDDYCNGDVVGWDNGFSLLYHSGHGGTLWTPYQPSNLANSNIPNFVYTEGCNEGDFGESTSSRTEQYMADNGCMFAGISNSAYGWFIASTWYGEEMFNLMFNETAGVFERCFCKAHFDSRENVGWELHSVAPMIFKETNFFGDPALDYHFQEETYIPSDSPNIFNEYPVNNSIDVRLFPRCHIDINNTNDVDVFWYSSLNGIDWTFKKTYNVLSSSLPGTFYCEQMYDNVPSTNTFPSGPVDEDSFYGIILEPSTSFWVNKVDIQVKRSGTFPSNATANVTIRATSGDLPTNILTGNNSVLVNNIGTGQHWEEFTLDRPVHLLSGTHYALCLGLNNVPSPDSHILYWGMQSGNPYGMENGNRQSVNRGITWEVMTAGDLDFVFKLWASSLFTEMDYDTTYYWKVAVDNGTQNVSEWYSFTTEQEELPPSQPTNPMPSNNSDYEDVYDIYLNCTVSDPNEDTMDVTFYWGNGTTIGVDLDVANDSTASIYFPDYIDPDWLVHDTTYAWYINTTDNDGTTTGPTWNFKTCKAWDLNVDRNVNYLDISILVSNYLQTVSPAGAESWDINNDGNTNYLDISSLISHYGDTY